MLLCTALLTACATGGSYAPVVDRQVTPAPLAVPPAKREPAQQVAQKLAARASDSYVVSRGETLYSIAWRANTDVKTLAAVNNIPPPYAIYPGQKLSLQAMATNKPAIIQPAQAKSVTVKPAAKPTTTVVPAKTAPAKTAVVSRNAPSNTSPADPSRWQWPTSGKMLYRYSVDKTARQGIGLAGERGDPVHAAHNGTVVYAGSALVGYGNLLIIKYDEHYLSAYGHNSALLVNEGDTVQAGQAIARMGDTGTNEVKLHFEIRRDGKPIDPLTLLPKKTS